MARFRVGDRVRIRNCDNVYQVLKYRISHNGFIIYELSNGGGYSEDWLEPAEESEADEVNNPSHYTDGGIETIDYIRAKLTAEEFNGYCKGNALKYISRAGKKGDAAEDIGKAIKYLGWIK